jgi:opacity protein-like surface antigen
MLKTITLALLAAGLVATAAAEQCVTPEILVETQQTSATTNAGYAWMQLGAQEYEGPLDGVVLAESDGLPSRIRYTFRSSGGTLILIGRPDPRTFAVLGTEGKAVLDIPVRVTSGRLDGRRVSSDGVVMVGTFDLATGAETFVSDNRGRICR